MTGVQTCALPIYVLAEARRLTDLGNSRRLVDRFRGGFRYVAEMGWVVWDGSRWRPDTQRRVYEAAKLVAQDLFDEADERYVNEQFAKVLGVG